MRLTLVLARFVEDALDEARRLGLDSKQVLSIAEALGVELVHFLGSRGTGGEPPELGRDFETPDRGAVSRGFGQDRANRVSRELRRPHRRPRGPLGKRL